MSIVLDILFPKYCLGCGKEGTYICKDCELFMNETNNPDNLITFWEYNGIVKEAIKRIKNGSYDIVKELISKRDFEIAENAYITYVPMYVKKQKTRGFNQAEVIAKELGKKSGRPVIKLLEKIRDTEDQTKLDEEERLENIRGSFKSIRSLQQTPLLLVDDFYTTGATMQECSETLKRAGFNEISYFAIAKAI